MKKFILILLATLTFNVANAQIQWYRTSSVAIKYKKYNVYTNSYYWTAWSDWESCICNVKIDIDNDIIVIYSNSTQVYKILYAETPPKDSTGVQVQLRVRDQDGDYGSLRLRVENNGNSQIYIDFADVMWVYNVRRIG